MRTHASTRPQPTAGVRARSRSGSVCAHRSRLEQHLSAATRLTLASAAVALLASGQAATVATAGGAGAARIRTATVAALRFSYPARLDHYEFSSCASPTQHKSCGRGVVVGSQPLETPDVGVRTVVPAGVAFELYCVPHQRPIAGVPAARFPLALAAFHPAAPGLPPGQSPRQLLFRAADANCWATAWVGQPAIRADRAALAATIVSIRPK